MARFAYRRSTFRRIVGLLIVPILLTSTGYALFSQTLSVQGAGTAPGYTSSNNLLVTYTKTLGTQGQRTSFNITMTVSNTGTTDIASWQVGFDMPTDFSSFSCQNTVNCSNSGATAAVTNTTNNGTILAGNSLVFTFSFRSYSTDYTLQNISVAGTAPANYQPIAGLTVSTAVGPRVKQGKWNYWDHTFTVTNNSGSTVTDWHILANWSSANNIVGSMSPTVNYVVDPTQLTILSTSSLANGQSFVFTANLGARSTGWTIGPLVIEGVI